MKSVVICGSGRFKEEAKDFGEKLKKLGAEVYMPHFYREPQEHWDSLSELDRTCIALGLTHDHFYKIKMADTVFVYNKNGYVGNSTTLEIGYAVALGKPIYALSEDSDEVCRNVLIRDIISSPEALLERLK
tara:strand:+ start:1961 stop:2353 length:393 start_codon:yes stop_codon:yes gene_type:complete